MDTLSEKMIDKLRADFQLVAEHRVKGGDWSEADAKEFGACIKECIERKDVVAVSAWAMWISDLAHSITTFTIVVRNAEIRIRDAALEAKEQKKAA